MRPERTVNRFVDQDRGIALIAALMIMLLMSALMIGFTSVVMSDQKYRGIDKDRSRAYYGAQSGLEKLTTDMGNLFLTNVAPTAAQITALGNTPPTIPNVTFVAPAGVTAYGITPVQFWCEGVLTFSCAAQIQNQPYAGLMALKKTYKLDAVARTTSGGEAHLTRKIESVAIPVFQFGMFSDVDLSFFAGPNFNFGGRIHTNGNLFLAHGGGASLTLTDKVTAVKDVIRQFMQNGVSIDNSPTHDGTISMATAPSAFRPLTRTEGSVVAGAGSALTANWTTISKSYYNSYIVNGGAPDHTNKGTGAKVLNLPMVAGGVGGQNTDLSRRAPQNEDVNNPVLYGERLFGKASLRILMSDKPGDITSLPTVTATAPIPLGEVGGAAPNWNAVVPAGLTAVGLNNPPIARSPGAMNALFVSNAATANGDTNIPFTYIAANFPTAATFHQPPYGAVATMDITQGANTNRVRCRSVTMTQFVNCTPTAAWVAMANGALLPPYVVNGVTYNATVNGAITGGGLATKTLTINSAPNAGPYTGAGPWALNTFWMAATDNAQFTAVPSNAAYANYPTLVTCRGFDSNAAWVLTNFRDCVGVPRTAANTPFVSQALHARDTGLVGGYIKIELQKADFTWMDVTAEILNYGIAGGNNDPGNNCVNATNSKAIVHLQRLKDTAVAGCAAGGSQESYDYWPNVLFDTREGLLRDVDPDDGRVTMGGLMHYVELDVTRLSQWFKCTAPFNVGVCNGTQAYSNNGYGVYFSDRRNNVYSGATPPIPNTLETAEYGFEDIVNPLSAVGAPSGGLPDGGEDVNANTLLDTYGQFPSMINAANQPVANSLPGGGLPSAAVLQPSWGGFNLTTLVRPWLTLNHAQGMVNRSYLFRRALKLVNGSLGNIVMPGLTVVAENPVYIQGDWNANQASTLTNYGDPHAATSVIADAVTLLSNSWYDVESFVNPYTPGNFNGGDRTRSAQSWYRVAIIAGKGQAFPWPIAGNPPNDFGTDGGAHNFLRYLEAGGTVNYRGAIATFYYNRQAVGTYKCCTTVYGAPTRNYNFDTDFLDPAKLPPLTPVFRDINALGFSQEIRPGR